MSQETVIEEATPAPPASPRQVALGLFILLQLAFLIASNCIGLIQSGVAEIKREPKELLNRLAPRFGNEDGYVWAWTEKIETCTRRWMQLTGQDQDWYLFAPSAGKATGVPVVLFVWDNPPPTGPSIPGSKMEFDARNGFNLITAWEKPPDNVVWLPSENAPADEKSFLKIGKARIRRFEGVFYMNTQPNDDETREQAEARMTRRMRSLITDSHDLILRYLQWRLRIWQRAHPSEPAPKQVILRERFYRIHGPDEQKPHGWDGPFLIPQARWLPDAKDQKGQYLAEPFDFSDLRFHPLAQ